MRVGSRPCQAGFTLIELLVTLAILIILIKMAVPGFQQMMASNRETSTALAIRGGLNLARSEAIKRRSFVSLSKTGGGLQVQVQGATLQHINLARQVTLTLPSGAITYTALGHLANSSGNRICAILADDNKLDFALTPAGMLSISSTDDCSNG